MNACRRMMVFLLATTKRLGVKLVRNLIVIAALNIALPLPLAAEEGRMVLSGDLSAVYRNGDFVLWTPKPKPEAASGAAMSMSMSMASASSSASAEQKPPSLESTVNVIAKAPLSEDGTFRIEVPVQTPRVAFFYVLNALSAEGHRLAPVKGQNLILEPGELKITMNARARYVVKGGRYNDAVFNSWKTSEEYLAAMDEQVRLWKPVEGETEEERRDRVDAASAAASRTYDIETEVRARVATTHPDPMVRRLVIESAWLHGPWILEALRGLAEMTPEDAWVMERLASNEEMAARRAEARKIATGTEILDFTADTLEGESVRLADVRADSELVLLEFWASWCGPCRVEIPHMKQAYEEHKPKGFEIVSFTIDNDREDWELASEEEDIPWLNLGMGEEAQAPTVYSVTGVPKNYLVESSTGEILATDLRQHHLDEKLDELLGD